jgi:hypothetical protein
MTSVGVRDIVIMTQALTRNNGPGNSPTGT